MTRPTSWGPTASVSRLRFRAGILARIRGFFAEREVLEVETPLLCRYATTEAHLRCFETVPSVFGPEPRYLHSSPESAMKRLLAAGSGPIYQLARVFREGERGRFHNPEFTMLEWYRPGFDHHDLMDEVADLLGALGATGPTERLSYQEVFQRAVGVDPLGASVAELAELARQQGLSVSEGFDRGDKDAWLELLVSHRVGPELGRDGPVFVYDYPASQAAFARIRPEQPAVAERFEVYWQGIELANGYHEVTDPEEQRERFQYDCRRRQALGLPRVEPDPRLLEALRSGMPPTAGVALGVDRLVMCLAGTARIEEVMAFPFEGA